MGSLDQLKAFFFDLSGTLIDESTDLHAHRQLLKIIIERYGLTGDLAECQRNYERHFGRVYDEMTADQEFRTLGSLHAEAFQILLVEGVLRGEIADNDQEMLQDVSRLSQEVHVRYARGFSASIGLLRLCRDLGYHVGIISDYDIKPLTKILAKTELDRFCDSITTSEEVRSYKPAKIIFSTALEKAGCNAQDSIYFGDRWERDIIGAKGAGMFTCLIGEKPAQAPQPDFLVGDIAQAATLVRNQLT
jgi:putative hydrolase of the HAD superfamily